MTTRTTWPLWQPPGETLETIAEVVAEHWNAAKASYREQLFWPSATSWLGACLTNDRRSEGGPDRAAFCDRFPRIADAYVRETIAERCRAGAAAVGEHWSDRLPGDRAGTYHFANGGKLIK
jgi:hypothetical protein